MTNYIIGTLNDNVRCYLKTVVLNVMVRFPNGLFFDGGYWWK